MDIFEAVENNDIEEVKKLLDSGVDVNSKDISDYPLIYTACFHGYIEIVKLLLKNPNIDLDFKIPSDSTVYLLPFLIDSIHVSNENDENNTTLQIIKLLLKHPNIDVNISDNYMRTPIIWAIDGNRPNIVKLLLEHPNININTPNHSYNNPLIHAILFNNKDTKIINLLLNHPKIDLNVRDTEYNNPIMTIFKNLDDFKNIDFAFEVLKIILTSPSAKDTLDINAVNSNNQSILHILCYEDRLFHNSSNKEIVNLILNNPNLDMTIRDEQGRTPFLVACTHNFNFLKLLMSHPNTKDKININDTDSRAYNCLITAFYNFNIRVFELLLKNPDLDINYKSTFILSLACSKFIELQKRNNDSELEEIKYLLFLLLRIPKIKKYKLLYYINENREFKQFIQKQKNGSLTHISSILDSIED